MAHKTIQQAIARINSLGKMNELLPAEFCLEGGLADGPIQGFKDNSLKPTQLRRIFSELTAIERKSREFKKSDLIRIVPKLAYASGRGHIPKEFYDLITKCIDKVQEPTEAERQSDEPTDFEVFMDYFRALLAFHKFRSKADKGGRQ